MFRTTHRQHRAAFTLIEILAVVTIMAILAVVVIPMFDSFADANKSTMATQLQTLRGQIELFRARNNGESPALEYSNDGRIAWAAMITGDPEYLYDAPINPYTGNSGIGSSESVAIGWVWDPVTASLTAPYYDEETGVYSPP